MRLYDLRALEIATFLGSCFAGAFLAWRNFRSLGEHDAARNSLLLGVAGLIVVAVAALLIEVPERAERSLGFAIQGAQVAAVHVLAKRGLASIYSAHSAAGGEFYSRWRAAGIAFLLFVPVAAVFLGIGLLLPAA
ncbi:MAG: hypothetical protein ACQGVC_05875 [Myxococcota bacterium]